MALLIFYVLLALGVSFLCSVMEAVLLSVTPSYVARLQQEGNPAGARLRRMKDDIDRPLAAILSLNTIAHTVGAAGAGAQAAYVFGDAYVGIISAVLTLLILVFSEIIPKTLGAVYWRRLAPSVTRLLSGTVFVLKWTGLIWLSQVITRLISRDRKKEGVSREEMAALAELGHQQGVFDKDESRILKNLFRFSSLRAKDIMTPRIVLFALPYDRRVADIVEQPEQLRFSRIPIYRQNRDDISGYVLKHQVLLRAAREDNLSESPLTLGDLCREILVVPASLALPDLFERLIDRLEHIALVVDEYGGTAGVVTMEDVVETLLGLEIVDEVDSAEDMQELARDQWRRRAERLGLWPAAEEEGEGGGVDPAAVVQEAKEHAAVARLGLTGAADVEVAHPERDQSRTSGAAAPPENAKADPPENAKANPPESAKAEAEKR